MSISNVWLQNSHVSVCVWVYLHWTPHPSLPPPSSWPSLPSLPPSLQQDVMQKPRCTQTARAGLACYTLMQLKKDIETERLKPLVIMDLIPLCSAQYDRLFGTTRIPGQEAGRWGRR